RDPLQRRHDRDGSAATALAVRGGRPMLRNWCNARPGMLWIASLALVACTWHTGAAVPPAGSATAAWSSLAAGQPTAVPVAVSTAGAGPLDLTVLPARNWLTNGGNLAQQRYSTLDQIH